MKKKVFTLLCVISILYGSSAVADILRTKEILFPNFSGHKLSTVKVHLEYGYAYHYTDYFNRCRTELVLLGINSNEYTEISEYEAILRGFICCPDCEANKTWDTLKSIASSIESSIEFELDTLETHIEDDIEFYLK